MKSKIGKFIDNLHIIWAITLKDIADALSNKLILSMVIGLSFMLLVPKGMSLIIVPPYTDIIVFDPGSSHLTTELNNSSLFQVRQVDSVDELEQMISSMGFGLGAEFGLVVPVDYDQRTQAGEQPDLNGYLNWSNRTKAAQIKQEFEDQVEGLIDQPVNIDFAGNIVYPTVESALMLGILTITFVTMILMIGISLVPFLLIEEKQTKTLDALLVSPVSVGQVISGKALAGFFYVLVASAVMYAIYWSEVVHWELAILFVIGSGLFSVAVGLVLGSFFDRQQEIGGWIMVLLVIFIAAMFVELLDLQLPAIIKAIIPWAPSVALGKIFIASFSVGAPMDQIMWNLFSVLVLALLLYAVVIWKIRRYDK